MALTGKIRYRHQKPLFGRPVLVLQVEDRYIKTTCFGGFIDSELVDRYRDARTEDLLELKQEGK